MVVWFWCGCLCEIWNFLEVEWEGIKWLSQNFSTCIYDLHEFKFISSQNPGVKIIWLLPFILNHKGFWKDFEFHSRNISNSETLCNSMIFPREDKMTSSNYRKYELEVFLKFSTAHFQNLSYWVLFKLFFSKNKIYGK